MGYPVEDCKKLAKELNVEDRITFTGKIPYEKASSYLKLGDLAVSPKTLESGEANAKLYNYLAMGLKVVCFDSKEKSSTTVTSAPAPMSKRSHGQSDPEN